MAKRFICKPVRALGSLLFIYSLSVPTASCASALIATQDVIGQARDKYYCLTRRNFNGFKATIEPNWEVILGQKATPQNLKVFRALRFSMTVDAKGAVTVKHEVAAGDEARVEAYVSQIHGNLQRLVAAFFGAWTMFMLRSPFTETESAIKIENINNEYRLFQTMQSGEVVLTMTSDLLITDWKVTGPRAKRTIKPRFHKDVEGLLLNGYRSIFEPVSEGIKTTLEVNIEYQDVSGMKLPHKVRISGMHGSEPVDAELVFDEYVLNPH